VVEDQEDSDQEVRTSRKSRLTEGNMDIESLKKRLTRSKKARQRSNNPFDEENKQEERATKVVGLGDVRNAMK